MTIIFKETDSLYKIFTTLKKLPSYKKVIVSFPDRHELFDHPWWGKQLADLVNEYHLDIRFLVSSRTTSKYFEDQQLSVLYEKPRTGLQSRRYGLNKTLSGKTITSHKKIVSWLIVLVEIAVFVLIVSFFSGVISPKATINVTPNAQIRPVTYKYLIYPQGSGLTYESSYTSPLTLGYEKVRVDYETSLTVDVGSISYESTPAQGTVTITNTLPESYSLVAGTQFVTDQGMVYRSESGIEVAAGTPEVPATTTVTLLGAHDNAYGVRQGEESNILAGTRLWIKNLSESMVMQSLWAEVDEGFMGGEVIASGVVSSGDIQQLREQLILTMDQNKTQYLAQATQEDTGYINLPFDEFVSFTPVEFRTDAANGDNLVQLEGTVSGILEYHRLRVADLLQSIQSFTTQRPVPGHTLLSHDIGSLRIYDLIQTETPGQWFVPLRLHTIRGYDFENDQNTLTSELVDRIKGLSITQAEDVILGYDQILNTTISMSPWWYDTLPDSSERIRFQLNVGE